ncbi:GumC family protein [Stygiobacter electus]|uniref:Wzz/FepE/Etk N-terminal domain-containing protein n=1 Tax=Stygiobacter electus TaxID=3032292 RepID=A0AAE3NU22_9BACT|nr:Wzz/FepE/Etk N-terminal domain-containing protein [Stygiobacter electus]MDF1610886.1 Wzz/FepE/Etk N-terminal domain-containing protein [Stygiobacter electus]
MENKEIIIEKEKVGSSLLEFISVLVKYRWFLFWFVFIITAGATTFALLSPKWYKSTSSVFPAEKNDLLSMLSGVSNLAKGFSASKGLAALTGSNSEADRYVAILKSSTMTKDIINKFNLRKHYKMEDDFYEDIVKEWFSNLELEIQDEGNLTITVYDKDPKLAATIANYLVQRLNEINTDLSITNAKANREFVEKRYFQNLTDIKNLETQMQSFQEKYGVVAVPEQIEATVKSMSTIYADLYKKEIEYNVLKQTYGLDHPLVNTSKIEMNELKNKIKQLNNGNDDSQKDVKLIIPFKEAPAIGNEYIKIFRNLEIQYKILEFIQPLYEQAKVEEARNTPSVLVIDKAEPATKKSKPKISIYASISLIVSLFLGLAIVFTLELLNKFKIMDSNKYNFIVSEFSKDLKKFSKK